MNKHILYIITAALLSEALLSCEKTVVLKQINPVQEKENKSEPNNPAKPSDDNKNEDYKEFSLSLPTVIDTLAYQSYEMTLTYKVDAQQADKIKATVASVTGAKADVSFNSADSKGIVTFTPEAESGSIVLSFTDGTKTKSCTVTFCAYYLKVLDAPTTFGRGEPFETSFTVDTNLAVEDLNVSANDWIFAVLDGNTVNIRLGANNTYNERSGFVTVSEREGKLAPVMVPIIQDWTIPIKDDCVVFRDGPFMKAMVDAADADGDGFVSFAEAEVVEVIDIVGKGIKNLTGLDAFKNVWKLDARNNDIVNADIICNLPFLRWLNLKGNMNLKTFDVRGCSMYFEVCDFEVTDDLNYQLYYRQMGVTWPDDKDCLHSHHYTDPRTTTDWSREGEIYQVQRHAKGPGKVALVFSGIGWIDVDINDGSFERIVLEAIDVMKTKPGWKENWEYFDVFVMIHMAERHSQWMYWDELIGHEGPEEAAKRNAYNEHRRALWKQMETSVDNKYCFKITVDNHSNMKINDAYVNLGGRIHLVPISGFDNKIEKRYRYWKLNEIFPEDPNDPNGFDNFHNGIIQWDDWKVFD